MANPVPVVDVTPTVVDALKSVPLARRQEGFGIPADLLREFLVPQAGDRVFPKVYVREGLLENGRLALSSDSLFANYQARVFEVDVGGRKQLVMAGFANDLELPLVSRSLPFLVYVPPSPQDTPKGHRLANRPLYDTTADADVPVFYGQDAGYPYAWDWLMFQIYSNAHRLSHQLRWAKRPYVFVVPLVRSFADGLGAMGDANVLEGVLLGIQRWYLARRPVPGVPQQPRDDGLGHVMLAAFSISTSILATFLERNRATPFVRTMVSDLLVLDPPPGNPANRSPVVDVALSVMRTHRSLRLLLYSQDRYYVDKAAAAVRAAGLSFDPQAQRLFADPRLPQLVIAFLDRTLFGEHVIDPVLRDVHNTFPNLFVADGARRSSLPFRTVDGKLVPQVGFLDFVPG